MVISILTLGCPKNQADTNRLLGLTAASGVSLTDDPARADVIMVNTCGFIEEAKRESIDEIMELISHKRADQRLLVFGCLAGRYPDELKAEIPEIDALFGVDSDAAILDYLGIEVPRAKGDSSITPIVMTPSLAAQPMPHSAPLKVAEGCDRKCTFCVIPSIRGGFSSRQPDVIIAEAASMIKDGAKEIMMVAQDLTSFDYEGYALPSLIKDLAHIEGEHWVRPMYFFPSNITEELLEAMASEPNVCKYVDMPVQHSVQRIINAMKRPGGSKDYLDKVDLVRKMMPEAAIRTSVILGFPGETEDEFEELLEFLREAQFDWVGAFRYSPEEGTPAALMPDQVEEELKEERIGELLEQQAGISAELNLRNVGKTMRVLVDEVSADRAIARTMQQAPDIDGITIVNTGGLEVGQFVDVCITGSHEFDLEATII